MLTTVPLIAETDSAESSRLSTYLTNLVNKPQLEDVVSVAEADSYRYVEIILESLAVLGRLGSALEIVSQRVSGEIHTLVESTLDEVEERCVDWLVGLTVDPNVTMRLVPYSSQNLAPDLTC